MSLESLAYTLLSTTELFALQHDRRRQLDGDVFRRGRVEVAAANRAAPDTNPAARVLVRLAGDDFDAGVGGVGPHVEVVQPQAAHP